MRYLPTITAALAIAGFAVLGHATTARADEAGSTISAHQAMDVATMIGVRTVNQIQYYDGRWEIEGYDPSGRNLNVDVDGHTGEVLKVDRWR